MSYVLGALLLACVGILVSILLRNKTLESAATAANQETERLRQHFEAETRRVYDEAQAAVADAQKLVEQQLAEINAESERVRLHYEGEARRSQEEADAVVSRTMREFEPLKKYAGLVDAQAEVQRQLAVAVGDANNLRADAQVLLQLARAAAEEQRARADEQAEEIRSQADARLDQAIREAGRILAEAERRAEQTAGDAYVALRDKQVLEQAATAIRNIVEGYGDRYVVPPYSVLDEFAEKFGYDEAGRALKAARDQTRRMVEQGQAASCDYVEDARRRTAIQFVIVAFDGYVDSILSRVRTDNYGTLEQKIKDAFAIVNHNGGAFRNARILPAYLDARLAELKWAAKVQQLANRVREEQRAEREAIRDRELAEKERQEQEREAARLVELKENALQQAEAEMAERLTHATEAQKAQFEQELDRLRQDLAEATLKKLSIAQMTRVGHIYIISNEGSFGPGVYKIGLTRRDPQVRVDELSDASVPFEFEIHGVIKTENAPALEYKLHRHFLATRMNKVNLSKEFFRVSLKEIRELVGKLAVGTDFTEPPQWRETEAGKVAEWQQSRQIDNDPVEHEKWLKREQVGADERWAKHLKRVAKRMERKTLPSVTSGGRSEVPATPKPDGTVSF